jgi:hypothetical protein
VTSTSFSTEFYESHGSLTHSTIPKKCANVPSSNAWQKSFWIRYRQADNPKSASEE